MPHTFLFKSKPTSVLDLRSFLTFDDYLKKKGLKDKYHKKFKEFRKIGEVTFYDFREHTSKMYQLFKQTQQRTKERVPFDLTEKFFNDLSKWPKEDVQVIFATDKDHLDIIG